ncbi:hypothetical protein [Paracoccus homiensis]|uniref:Uncharacterized protein n=1 Tax=Paracoccus homiensis TaxID=364199 RepID=A0A1I0IZ93_9RHOB|nr:hypothetical protein [Paracoccus homiensis]SEU02743.1 hypothetical protein SAMN04489858_12033 [Paracoccus homiensis]
MMCPTEARRSREMWCAAVMTVFHDSWRQLGRKNANPADIRRHALLYFSSKDGIEVVSLTGIDATPEQLADVCIDPTARDRIKRLEDL